MTDVEKLLRQLGLEPWFTLGVIADACRDAGEDRLEEAYRYLIAHRKEPLVRRPGGMKADPFFMWTKNGNGVGRHALYEDRFPGLATWTRVESQLHVYRVPVSYPDLGAAYEAAARAYRPRGEKP